MFTGARHKHRAQDVKKIIFCAPCSCLELCTLVLHAWLNKCLLHRLVVVVVVVNPLKGLYRGEVACVLLKLSHD